MKVIAYAVRSDEMRAFNHFSKEMNIQVTYVEHRLTIDNVHLAQGHDGVSIIGHCDASESVLTKLKDMGIEYVASRSTGYDNIDLSAAKKLGIKVTNARYSPNSVAEFALMLILMVNRKVGESFKRSEVNDFSLRNLRGFELRNQTVGIIGTGRIGATLAQNLTGFGCRILAYDEYANTTLNKTVEYVDLETLLMTSDVISLHLPLNEQNHHFMDESRFKKMKESAIIVNTSRGELINTKELIQALSSKQILGAGLDVLEGEFGKFHHDLQSTEFEWHDYKHLKQLNNVIITNHFAFYTDQAVSDMVECSLISLSKFYHQEDNPWIIQS
jgi:lactate dehydrogenase-like 2-hydroxyacid dehydrogenase